MKYVVKIVSGYSDKGGSTTAFINLTNFFNDNGIDCTFYGPHDWHLNKCKSDLLKNVKYDSDDIVIFHFLDLKERPNVKRAILSCHEKWWFPVGKITKYWDTVVFLHDQHRDYHKEYTGDFVIIPNLKEHLNVSDKTNVKKNISVKSNSSSDKSIANDSDEELEEEPEKPKDKYLAGVCFLKMKK